jgi:hypothetical protein
MKNVAVIAISALVLAACAMEPTTASTEPYQEKEYQTGSNIAKKKTGAVVIDKETMDRLKDTGQPANRPGKAN